MPKVTLLSKINGYAFLLRFITPTLIIVVLTVLMNFDRKIDTIKDNMVYKSEYKEDYAYLRGRLDRLSNDEGNFTFSKGGIYGRRQILTRFETTGSDKEEIKRGH